MPSLSDGRIDEQWLQLLNFVTRGGKVAGDVDAQRRRPEPGDRLSGLRDVELLDRRDELRLNFVCLAEEGRGQYEGVVELRSLFITHLADHANLLQRSGGRYSRDVSRSID